MKHGLIIFDEGPWVSEHQRALQGKFPGAALSYRDSTSDVESALARMLGTDEAGHYCGDGRRTGEWRVVLVLGDDSEEAVSLCDSLVERGFAGSVIWIGTREPPKRYPGSDVWQGHIPLYDSGAYARFVQQVIDCWER